MDRKAFLGIGIGLLVILLSIGGWMLHRVWYDRKAPNFTENIDFYLYPEMTPAAVCDSLLATGKVRNAASLKRTLGPLKEFRTGHYTIASSSSSMYVARMLQHGWQTPVQLTLSGSLRTPGVLARKIASQMLADSAAVAAFVSSDDSLRAYGADCRQLFTLIIPDTYQLFWTASVREIFDRLVKERNAWWTPERQAAAARQGLSLQEVSVLASIVDGETRYVPEQPTIAGVYLNRLHAGMKLQADPTVAYCFDYKLNRILKKHLDVDSPYNTYRHYGLPPGPISCPPKTCLEAVLYPASHNYLFFCADPSFNGSHRFAATYSEHLANARAFQKALTERQRARQQ